MIPRIFLLSFLTIVLALATIAEAAPRGMACGPRGCGPSANGNAGSLGAFRGRLRGRAKAILARLSHPFRR